MASIFPIRSRSRLGRSDSSVVVMSSLSSLKYIGLKYVLDLISAVVIFILAAPLMLFAMLLVKLTSRGPALYVQLRMGRNAIPFPICKVRSMHHQCEMISGARWSMPGDTRIFPLGRWLRRTHLDELPQLWNVLRGDMSLVGPRPERPEFVPQLEQAIAHYDKRMLIRPGVTGLAQVQLPPDTDLSSVRVKLAYDLYYLKNVSFWLDLRIVAATAFKMVGMPFSTIRRCFGFPTQTDVMILYHNFDLVNAYQSLVETPVGVDIQPCPSREA